MSTTPTSLYPYEPEEEVHDLLVFILSVFVGGALLRALAQQIWRLEWNGVDATGELVAIQTKAYESCPRNEKNLLRGVAYLIRELAGEPSRTKNPVCSKLYRNFVVVKSKGVYRIEVDIKPDLEVGAPVRFRHSLLSRRDATMDSGLKRFLAYGFQSFLAVLFWFKAGYLWNEHYRSRNATVGDGAQAPIQPGSGAPYPLPPKGRSMRFYLRRRARRGNY